MLVVYKRLTEKQLRKDAKDAIKQITEWFAENPKRRVCRAELFYGKTISVKRKTITEQVTKLLEEVL